MLLTHSCIVRKAQVAVVVVRVVAAAGRHLLARAADVMPCRSLAVGVVLGWGRRALAKGLQQHCQLLLLVLVLLLR